MLYKDLTAFIFNLHPHQTKHKVSYSAEYSVRHEDSWLISFGQAPDIRIKENCDIEMSSYSNFGDSDSSFSTKEGSKGVKIDNAYMAGTRKFKLSELEIYAV